MLRTRVRAFGNLRIALALTVLGGFVANASVSEALEFLVDSQMEPLEGMVTVPWATGAFGDNETPLPATSPTTAWLPVSQFQTNGGVVVGHTVFDEDAGLPMSAFSFSPSWWTDADWGPFAVQHSEAHNPFLPWPQPFNAADIYPDHPEAEWRYTGVAEVLSNSMLDVAVTANYAFVPDAEILGAPETDVVIVTALHDPASAGLITTSAYAVSQIVTVSGGTYWSGGSVTPGSVDMALRTQAQSFGEDPTTTAIPLYLLWESQTNPGPTWDAHEGWWLAAVTVGTDGSISLYRQPEPIDEIPFGSAWASVAARVDPNGDEIVEIAWAQLDPDEGPQTIPTCPSSDTVKMKWYHAISVNGGTFRCANEDCPGGSFGYGPAEVDSDDAYRFCVGASRTTNPRGDRASPRPEIAFNDLGDMDYGRMHRFMAYPRSEDGDGTMRIRVMRDHLTYGDPDGTYPLNALAWQLAFQSATGGDSYAPALHVSPGRAFDSLNFPFHVIDEHALVGLLYRQDDGGDVRIETAHSNESGDWSSWIVEDGSTTGWAITEPYEFRQGLTAKSRCMDPVDCPTVPSSNLWFGVWTDERDELGPQVYGATYQN